MLVHGGFISFSVVMLVVMLRPSLAERTFVGQQSPRPRKEFDNAGPYPQQRGGQRQRHQQVRQNGEEAEIDYQPAKHALTMRDGQLQGRGELQHEGHPAESGAAKRMVCSQNILGLEAMP
ncbi:MAG: hypothetical protein ACYC2J_01380 [Acidithiobacillus ferrooxidans]